MDRQSSALGAAIMRKMGLGIMPTPEDAARMDRAMEMDAADKAMAGNPVVKPKIQEPPKPGSLDGTRAGVFTKKQPRKRSEPNAAQIELLRKSPDLAPHFDERFGQGMSETYLKPHSEILSRTQLGDGSTETTYSDGWVEVVGGDGSISGRQAGKPQQ